MKYRGGFVSNSSSASFTIALESLTQAQISYIHDHPTSYPWSVWEDEKNIYGQSSSMIFDMEKYLGDIGVDKAKIIWEYR